MMFDDTIKLYATSADDDNHYGDEAEDDHRFGDDDEEEEVTMTSDDDEELDIDDDGTLHGTHAEDAQSSRCLHRRSGAMNPQLRLQSCR